MPKLCTRLDDAAWTPIAVGNWYGGKKNKILKNLSGTALWHRPGTSPKSIRRVLVRDPDGEREPQAFFSTDPGIEPEKIISIFVRRWQIEVTFQEARAHLGVETQRQWSNLAIGRTTPILLGLFSLICLWTGDILARSPHPFKAAWYEKTRFTFSDAIATVRTEIWLDWTFQHSTPDPERKEIPPPGTASSLVCDLADESHLPMLPPGKVKRMIETLCYAASLSKVELRRRRMDRLGVGIIGCGNISGAYLALAPLFRSLEVRAVADINHEAARTRAEEYQVAALSVEELLGSKDVDVVINLTVPDAHYSVSSSILEAGKHVYSEKPLVLTLEQGRRLRELASERDLRIGSAPDTFLGGSYQLARERIDAGVIGDVIAGTAHVMSHGMEHWHPNPDFFYLPGGGPVLDVGPYYITNLIHLLGPVKRVAAIATAADSARTILTPGPRKGEEIPVQTPTNVHSLLDFHSGATVTLSASWDVWAHRHNRMELYGRKGSLSLPDPNFFGGTVDRAGRDGVFAPLEEWDHPFGVPNEHQNATSRANYRTAGLADMANALIRNEPHRCSLDLAIHVVDVMTSILRSGECGEWCRLSTTCERPDPLLPGEARELLA